MDFIKVIESVHKLDIFNRYTYYQIKELKTGDSLIGKLWWGPQRTISFLSFFIVNLLWKCSCWRQLHFYFISDVRWLPLKTSPIWLRSAAQCSAGALLRMLRHARTRWDPGLPERTEYGLYHKLFYYYQLALTYLGDPYIILIYPWWVYAYFIRVCFFFLI